METKICSNSKCNKELPATTEFFYRHKGGKFDLSSNCKECRKKYWRNNKEQRSLYNKQYYKDNKENILQRVNKYYNDNKNIRLEYFKIYSRTERGKVVRNKKTKRYKERNRLSCAVSNAMRVSLKNNKANRHWEGLVNYTLKDLKQHLENLFGPGMGWDNYGVRGWHVDHIRPISSFCVEKLQDINSKEFKECWSLDNLQPLWWYDNLSKGNKCGS